MQELPSWRYLPEGANARNVPVERRSDTWQTESPVSGKKNWTSSDIDMKRGKRKSCGGYGKGGKRGR